MREFLEFFFSLRRVVQLLFVAAAFALLLISGAALNALSGYGFTYAAEVTPGAWLVVVLICTFLFLIVRWLFYGKK